MLSLLRGGHAHGRGGGLPHRNLDGGRIGGLLGGKPLTAALPRWVTDLLRRRFCSLTIGVLWHGLCGLPLSVLGHRLCGRLRLQRHRADCLLG